MPRGLLALIGRGWLTATDETGLPRLDKDRFKDDTERLTRALGKALA